MEWVNHLNAGIEYIEAHLKGQIDIFEAARRACCSLTKFQRLFLFATDMTLSEYIRCRRMTLAAKELVSSSIKIIDLAYQYGYESSESFTRAFHTFHGMPPSLVRKLKTYHEMRQISIHLQIQGGEVIMGKKPIVRIEEFNGARAATFRVNGEAPEERAFLLLRQWATENLKDYAARRCIGYAPQGHHPQGEASDAHEYVVQMLLYEGEASGRSQYRGAEVQPVPQGLYLVGDVALNEFHEDGALDIGLSMKKSSQEIYACLLSMDAYTLDMENRPFIEEQIFQPEWFTGEGSSEFKLWLPIKIK